VESSLLTKPSKLGCLQTGGMNACVLISASHPKFLVLYGLYKDKNPSVRHSAIPVVKTMCTHIYIKIISTFRSA